MKYLLIFMSAILLASCSVQTKHRRSQARHYNQCWCLDPFNGGAEWCCDGPAPKYMAPYKHSKGYIRAQF